MNDDRILIEQLNGKLQQLEATILGRIQSLADKLDVIHCERIRMEKKLDEMDDEMKRMQGDLIRLKTLGVIAAVSAVGGGGMLGAVLKAFL